MKQFLIIPLFLLSIAFAVARPDLTNARPGSTPYDPYHAPVKAVLRQLDGPAPSFATVAALTKQGFAIRYVFDEPYRAQLPAETVKKGSGDCKAKSLWLASRMNDANVRYVIGKAHRTSKISHAWLMWEHKNRWWVLDPTNSPTPIAADSLSPDEYIILYSYDKNGSYRHKGGKARRVADK